MPMYIYTWNRVSEGANELKRLLGIQSIKHENSRFVGRPNKTVINWGSSELPEQVMRCRVLNRPEIVASCSNKRTFFETIARQNRNLLPPFTTNFDEAMGWVEADYDVCARTVLQGHSARGLVIMKRDNPETFVRAPLYTQYIKKQEEYRVHIIRGNVVDYQRKVLRAERAESGEEINWQVRNLDNGFIYQRGGVELRDSARRVAIETMNLTGLDFGGVDVIWNRRENRSYVLEINTAPGITETTVQNYANGFRRIMNG